MARRKKRAEEQPRELTRKEVRLNARTRERNRKLIIGTAIAVGFALLVITFGAIAEFAIKPNSTLARVGDETIVTRDFWKRVYLQRSRLQNQLIQMQQLEQQFGGQGFFTAQINQVQATLSSPFALGVQVLDQMINEAIIRKEAAARGITVSDEEVEAALQEEVAASQGAVTVPQATATAEAASAATATAASWTPTPTPTIDVSAAVTATATPLPTPAPAPTRPILTDSQYQEGLAQLEQSLREIAGMSLDEYREVIRIRLLSDKLAEVIGKEQVAETEEAVHARHILIRFTETPPPPETSLEVSPTLTSTVPLTVSAAITAQDMLSDTAVEATASSSTTITATGAVSATAEITATANLSETAQGESVDPSLRSEAEALALAQELRQRILGGEDFATLAQEYSDDPGSAANGGDLGWFGRGMMVPAFEEAAFSLAVGEVSKPIKTDFGYHLIEVLEKDPNHPKDASTLANERRQAFQEWLQEQVAATPIQRPDDLVSKLPRDLRSASLSGLTP